MNSTPDLTVVVPTYQEAENLPELVTRLFAAVSSAQVATELIIVDDNSGDATVEICEELSRTFPLRLITRTDERGLATAVMRGLEEACGRYIVVMDADLSHPPMSVPALMAPLESGAADFVIGSRYVHGGSVAEDWSLWRFVNSKVATFLAVGLTTAKDPMAGFFAIRRSSLVDLSTLNPCGYKIGLELMVRCGCKTVVEVPIHFADRKHGESKLNLREQWLYIQHLTRLYAFRYPDVLRFAKFAAVGVSGLVVDLMTFRASLPGLGLAAARALGIGTAMTWNYEWNRRVTFAGTGEQRSVGSYLRFCTACLSGAVLSWTTSLGLMNVVDAFQQRPVAAALVGTCVAAVVNYALCRIWVFSERSQETVESTLPEAIVAESAILPFEAPVQPDDQVVLPARKAA